MKLTHILKAKEFRDVIGTGERVKGQLVGLYSKGYGPNKKISVGVVISKKVAPRAVTRNYLKRVIYLFFTQKRDKIIAGTRIVVRVIKAVEKQKRKSIAKQIRTELEALTRQAKLTND